MAILVGVPSGGVVSLAEVDTSRMFEGTLISELVTGRVFKLTPSNATVDHTTVESVKNNGNLRWVLFTTGGSLVSRNLNNVYVSPDGDNADDGLSWETAMRTGYAALVRLRELGGGNLFVASGVDVDGPVTDQGWWFRRDQSITFSDEWYETNGFIPLDVPINIIGCGNDEGIGAFAFAPMTNFNGGGFSRFKPPVWVLGAGTAKPLTMTNMQTTSGILGAKTAVDYDRNVDGSLKFLTITNATRTGTTTVFTVTLPTAIHPTFARRISNVTRLYIPNPGIPYQPWRVGQVIRVTSTNPDFTSGDYAITDMSNAGNEGDNLFWYIYYTEVDGDAPEVPVADIAVQSHNCSTGELIDLVTANTHWKNTQYKVLSGTTADAIHVLDEHGDGNANVNNVGTLIHQERFYGHTSMVNYVNCAFAVSQTPDPGFVPGHGFDFGSNLAIAPTMSRCWIMGNGTGFGLNGRDERICAGVYTYAGLHAGANVVIDLCYGANGNIFVEAGSDGIDGIDCRRTLLEAAAGGDASPGILVRGNSLTNVFVDYFRKADGAIGVPWVELFGMPLSNSIVTRSGIVRGVCVGGDSWQQPNLWFSPNTTVNTPWQGQNGMQVTTWADGRITGKHPASIRSGAPVSARFKNIVVDPASWVFDGAGHVDEGFPDRRGGLNAQRITTSGDQYISIFPAGVDGNTWQVGGLFVISFWVNSQNAATFDAVVASVRTTGVTFDPDMPNVTQDASGVHFATPYFGQGWQQMQFVAPVAVVSDSTPTFSVDLSFHTGTEVFICEATAYYMPLSVTAGGDTVPNANSDLYEHAGTIHTQPRYLRQGEAGTMEGQPFFAHGSFGTVIGALTLEASGNGKTIAIRDAATGAIAGYLELRDEA